MKRAGQRLAHRHRRHRRRLPPPGQRPHGHHRRPLGTRPRQSHPQTPRPDQQRRLRRLLDLPPRPGAATNPPHPLPRRRHPLLNSTDQPVTPKDPHPYQLARDNRRRATTRQAGTNDRTTPATPPGQLGWQTADPRPATYSDELGSGIRGAQTPTLTNPVTRMTRKETGTSRVHANAWSWSSRMRG